MKFFIGSIYQNTITPPSSTYETEADALFSRFTNTYSDTEKDLINTLIIDLKDGGIWDKLAIAYIGALSGKEEQLLDLKSDTYNLTTHIGSVTQVPYKGLTPQDGTYDTSFDTSTLDINGSFICWKTYQDYTIPSPAYYFGSDDQYLRCKPIEISSKKGYAVNLFSAPANFSLKTGEKMSDTTILNWDGTNYNAYLKGALNSSQAPVQGRVLPTGTFKLGGINDTWKQTNPVQFQFLAVGNEALTDTEAKLLTNLIDTFVAAQEALDVDYIQQTGYKVYQPQKYYADWNPNTNACVWFDITTMYYSSDGGVTVTNSASIPTAGTHIQMARIFDDGKIIFAMSDNKIYKTDSTLVFTEMTPTKNGSTYTLHTPIDANYPGEYYKWLGIRNSQYLADGTEIFVWSNYGNVQRGASPLIIWYSFGTDVKVAYEFGQNPYLRDNGSFVPSSIAGTLLGDATEDIYSRHNHAVQQNPFDLNKFYFCGGDYDRASLNGVRAFNEAVWLEVEYNQTLDTMTRTLLTEKSVTTKWKCTSLEMPNDGYIYFTSDLIIDGTNTDEVGIFRVPYADIGNDLATELVYYPDDDTKPMNHCFYDGTDLIGGYASGANVTGRFGPANIIISRDSANTFIEELMSIAGNIYFFSVTKIASGKFKLDYMNQYDYRSAFSIILDFN